MKLTVLILCLTLSGCSLMDAVSFFTPSKGIEAELTVGDKSEAIETTLKAKEENTTTHNTAENLNQDNRHIDFGMSISDKIFTYGLTLLFGWLGMPSLWEMRRK